MNHANSSGSSPEKQPRSSDRGISLVQEKRETRLGFLRQPERFDRKHGEFRQDDDLASGFTEEGIGPFA